jgi:hypothetical protein
MIHFYPTSHKKILILALFCLVSVFSFAQSCLNVTGNITNASCYGSATGAITVSTTGGSGNYIYTWNGAGGIYNGQNRTGLIAGSYILTVKDANNSGCLSIQTFEVSQPTPLNIEWIEKTWYNGYGLSCANSQDGQLTIYTSGGTGTYEYSLNGGPFQASNVFSNLPAGTYYTTIKDANGCLVTSDPNSSLPHSVDYINPLVTISGPDPIVIDPISVLPTGATGDSIVIFASQSIDLVAGNITGGIAPYSYLWSPFTGMGDPSSNLITVAPTTTTTYTLTVTDANGCTATRTFKVVVNQISGGTGGGTGGTGGGGGGNHVTVCHNGRQMSVSLSALPSHIRHGDGIGFCSPYGTKAVVTAEGAEHAEVVVAANRIYPNPSHGKFAIRLTNVSSKIEIQVVNALGIITEKRMISNAIEETIQQFDLTGKPSGVYFIKVSGASFKSEVYRVLIK